MANEKRLIDANAYPCQNCEVSYCYQNCKKFNEWFNKTVDAVEVVHGRWYDVALRYTEVKEECSVCHGVVRVHGFRYCPNCGAKMDGERKDNERKAD